MVQLYPSSNIITYGALLLPFDEKLTEEQAQTQTDPKEKTSFMGKLKSAIKKTKGRFTNL